MNSQVQEPITNLVGEFFDSAGIGGSFFGQIAKKLIMETLSRYMSAENKEQGLDIQSSGRFSKLADKWNRIMQRDVRRLGLSENERKLLFGIFLALMSSQIVTGETDDTETDLATE